MIEETSPNISVSQEDLQKPYKKPFWKPNARIFVFFIIVVYVLGLAYSKHITNNLPETFEYNQTMIDQLSQNKITSLNEAKVFGQKYTINTGRDNSIVKDGEDWSYSTPIEVTKNTKISVGSINDPQTVFHLQKTVFCLIVTKDSVKVRTTSPLIPFADNIGFVKNNVCDFSPFGYIFTLDPTTKTFK